MRKIINLQTGEVTEDATFVSPSFPVVEVSNEMAQLKARIAALEQELANIKTEERRT